MRLFLAINLPLDERRTIVRATSPMREAARGVSWVTEERLHLTMKFFGERPPDAEASLAAALRPVLASHQPLALRLGGLGAFPNLRVPRVVWLGVEREPRLELLQHEIERACAELGYEVDGRAFRPHITLGRARSPLPSSDARALAAAARGVGYEGEIEVRTVDLMASELLPAGARYTVRAAIPLGEE